MFTVRPRRVNLNSNAAGVTPRRAVNPRPQPIAPPDVSLGTADDLLLPRTINPRTPPPPEGVGNSDASTFTMTPRRPAAATPPFVPGDMSQMESEPYNIVRPRTATTRPPDQNGRVGSFVSMLLQSLAPSMQEATANARGRRFDASDFMNGVAGAVGGGVAAAIDPRVDEDAQQWRTVAEADARISAGLGRRAAVADVENREGLAYLNNVVRPGVAAAQVENRALVADARALKDRQQAVRADLKNHPLPFDPNDPNDAAFLQRAAEAGVFIDPTSWGRDTKNPYSIEIVDPENPTRKTRLIYNRQTGEFSPLAVGGQTVATGYVTPINPETGLTPAQALADADRDAGREQGAEQFNRTYAQRERFATARENRRSAPGGVGGELTPAQAQSRARSIQTSLARFEALKGKAMSARTERERTGAMQQARVMADVLAATYPDAVEVGDSNGWPYAKIKGGAAAAHPMGGVTPRGRRPAEQQQSVYAGRRISRAKLPEAARRLGMSTEAAESLITAQGGTIY